jgi:probable HAF family extracellular repeat protein
LNPVTGNPTVHPLLWRAGRMLDLGTLGGSYAFATGLNERGQVLVQSTLAGDQSFHAFIWENGTATDLGTLGGSVVVGDWLSNTGEVVGRAFLEGDEVYHAFLWRDHVLLDLGASSQDCSQALGVNSRRQIVGYSVNCSEFPFPDLHALLWERGEEPVDLNTLLSQPSELILTIASAINEKGEITGGALLPSGDTHTYLLVPCDELHPDTPDCDYRSLEDHQLAREKSEFSSPTNRDNPARVSATSKAHVLAERLFKRTRP